MNDLEEQLANKSEQNEYGPNLDDLNANLKTQVAELEKELSAKISTLQKNQNQMGAEVSLKRERVQAILSTFKNGLEALSTAGNLRVNHM